MIIEFRFHWLNWTNNGIERELAQEWNEFDISERKLTIHEVLEGAKTGSLLEMFGTGTAAIVSPVGNILYDGEMKALPVPEEDKSLAQR